MKQKPIDLHNYQEYFLLYLDDELSASVKAEVENFIESNPAVKNEWVEWQSTRLQPEAIIFPDKSKLYKNSGQLIPAETRTAAITSKQAIGNYLWPSAAAAAILMIVLLFAWQDEKSDPVNTGIISQINKETTTQKEDKKLDVKIIPQEKIPSENGSISTTSRNHIKEEIKELAQVNETPKTSFIKPADEISVEKNNIVEENTSSAKNSQAANISEDIGIPVHSPLPDHNTELGKKFSAPVQYKQDYATEALFSEALNKVIADEIPTGSRKRPLRKIIRQVSNIYERITHPEIKKPVAKMGNMEISL